MVGARLDGGDRRAEGLRIEGDLSPAELRSDLKEAYERGRRDERASRKHHPIAMTLTFAAALVGVVILGLAAVNGSFQAAGGVVDQNLHMAANHPAIAG